MITCIHFVDNTDNQRKVLNQDPPESIGYREKTKHVLGLPFHCYVNKYNTRRSCKHYQQDKHNSDNGRGIELKMSLLIETLNCLTKALLVKTLIYLESKFIFMYSRSLEIRHAMSSPFYSWHQKTNTGKDQPTDFGPHVHLLRQLGLSLVSAVIPTDSLILIHVLNENP